MRCLHGQEDNVDSQGKGRKMKRTASEGSGGVGALKRSFQRLTSQKPKTLDKSLSDATNGEHSCSIMSAPVAANETSLHTQGKKSYCCSQPFFQGSCVRRSLGLSDTLLPWPWYLLFSHRVLSSQIYEVPLLSISTPGLCADAQLML